MKNACYFIPTYYFDWLKSFRFNPKQLNITYNEETKELGIEATGLLYEVTLWEVPILAIISEVQTLEQGPIDTLYIIRKTVEKATIAELYNKTGRKLTIYHMFESPRNIPEGYEPPIGIEEILDCSVSTISGFKSDEERDSAMTRDSDFDIVFVKDDRWDSGTAQNIKRRHNI